MSLVRLIRKSKCGLVSFRAAVMCVAAFSLLWARVTPPGLPHTSLSLSFSSHAAHDQRQCFDHEDVQWTTSASAPLAVPPPVVSLGPIHSAEPFVEIATDGWHYNRPPPIS
jgi:hypothetical protein